MAYAQFFDCEHRTDRTCKGNQAAKGIGFVHTEKTARYSAEAGCNQLRTLANCGQPDAQRHFDRKQACARQREAAHIIQKQAQNICTFVDQPVRFFFFRILFCTFHFIIPFFKNTVQNNFKYLKKEKLSVIEMRENIFLKFFVKIIFLLFKCRILCYNKSNIY